MKSVVMNPVPTTGLAWLHASFLLLLSIAFHSSIISCSKTQISYTDYCNSVVPESKPTEPEFAIVPFPPNQNGYYNGGDEMLNPKSPYYSPADSKGLLFQTHGVLRTSDEGVYDIKASLIIERSDYYFVEDFSNDRSSYYSWASPRRSKNGVLSFELRGFWSKSSGKLCMVGSSSTYSQDGKLLDLDVVLKLNDVNSFSNITSLVRGTLESLSLADDSSHFKPISLLMFPKANYIYTKVSKEVDDCCAGSGDDVPKNSSLSLPLSRPICSILKSSFNAFELNYASPCDSDSAKGCNPFGESTGYLPQVMSLRTTQCSEDRQSLRVLLEFPNTSYAGYYYHSFNPRQTLVGEGSWDGKKNRLCVAACRILNKTSSFSSTYVEDCSIRLSLMIPSVWSIHNTSSFVGQLWSTKDVKDSSYFPKISFRSVEKNRIGVQGVKYEYTLIDKARNSCSKKPNKKIEGIYPDGDSNDMRLDMSIKNSKRRRIGWGSAYPLSVGDEVLQGNQYYMTVSGSELVNSQAAANSRNNTPVNMSYKLSFYLKPGTNLPGWTVPSSNEYQSFEVTAEGIYDPETGVLCMAGCRNVLSKNQTLTANKYNSTDCKILVSLQFPPLDSKNGDYIKGSIESTREKSDPLCFEHIHVSAVSYYWSQASQSIWRMDLEIIMALISNTLSCIFVGYQILYVKTHRGVFPFISILMLVILTLGHMIPLVLNFEALFFQKSNSQPVLSETAGWVEVNEVIVRIVTMIAFLLQFRLLQLTWFVRLGGENPMASWETEKKVLYVSFPLYIGGGLATFFVTWVKNRMGSVNAHLWGQLRSYGGLVLDGFLLPQILFNIFEDSRENALSRLFYIGNTLVRLLPHAYDLYRANNYADRFDGWSYIYADPDTDFFSTAWDCIIPLGGLLFASVIYLQQRHGGRYVLPRRFKEPKEYEKAPVTDEE